MHFLDTMADLMVLMPGEKIKTNL